MTKKMRELEEQIAKKIADATAFSEGETKDLARQTLLLMKRMLLLKNLKR